MFSVPLIPIITYKETFVNIFSQKNLIFFMHLHFFLAIRALLCSAILHYPLKRSKTRSNEVLIKAIHSLM